MLMLRNWKEGNFGKKLLRWSLPELPFKDVRIEVQRFRIANLAKFIEFHVFWINGLAIYILIRFRYTYWLIFPLFETSFILQVSENCCSEDGKKWNAIFQGVSPGKVCCNAPCKDADFLKCGQLGRCNQRSFSPYLNPYDYGFGYHTQKKIPIGSLYPSLYSTIDNKEQFEVRILCFLTSQN